MSTRSVGPPFEVFRTPYYRQTSPQRPLKRKFDSLVSPASTRVPLGYPSPPMSGPPSPLPPPSEKPVHTSAETHVASQHAFAPAPTSFRSTALQSQPWTTSERTSFAAPSLGPAASQPSELGTLQTSQTFATASLPPVYGTGAAGSSTSRTGRKSKAHVASACVNCKRAHLSCDVQRPCGRCMASGKQDTCIDVQHKKRGRPRLREDSEVDAEQTASRQRLGASVNVPAEASVPRPIAGMRHGRTESLRSLRSQVDDGTSVTALQPSSSLPPMPALQPSAPYLRPHRPASELSPGEIPTAYLNLDLSFLRANGPFQQILSPGQQVVGRRVPEIAVSVDGENFESISERLKAERDAREPAYMPPIMQAGFDPVQGVNDADVDRLTYGFSDRTYTWQRSLPNGGTERFPARVRLAKATSYFVVITLPSFRPMPPPNAPSSASSTFASPSPRQVSEIQPSRRQLAPQASPFMSQYSSGGIGSPSAQQRQYTGYQPYHLSQFSPSTPYQPQPAYQGHQLPISPFAARSLFMTQQPGVPSQPAPPHVRQANFPTGTLYEAPPNAAPLSTANVASAPTEGSFRDVSATAEEYDEDEDGRPSSGKKRRRLNIDDVLSR